MSRYSHYKRAYMSRNTALYVLSSFSSLMYLFSSSSNHVSLFHWYCNTLLRIKYHLRVYQFFVFVLPEFSVILCKDIQSRAFLFFSWPYCRCGFVFLQLWFSIWNTMSVRGVFYLLFLHCSSLTRIAFNLRHAF